MITKIILFLLILLIVIFVCENKLKKKRCNLKVRGKIIDRWTEEVGTYSRNAKRKGYRTYIVIEYKYNNETYSTTRGVSPFMKCEIHDEIEIMINQKNPEESSGAYIAEEIIEKRKTSGDKLVKIILLLPLICFVGLVLYIVIGTILEKLNILL